MPPSALPVLAHGFGRANGLPLPRWLLAYGVGFGVLLAAPMYPLGAALVVAAVGAVALLLET